jgi:MacB-like periplasmic core domain
MTVFKQRPHQISEIEVAQMAIAALWSNKLRSALTMLGVIIGISSTIEISSIGQGVQKSTADRFVGWVARSKTQLTNTPTHWKCWVSFFNPTYSKRFVRQSADREI